MSISQPLAARRDVDMPTGKTGMTGSIQYDEPQSGSSTFGWRAVTIRDQYPGAGEHDCAYDPGSEVPRDGHGAKSDGVQKKSDALRAVPASQPAAEHLRDMTSDDLNTALSSLIDKLQRNLAEINKMLAHW